jgi:hypothetical protein
MGTVISNLKARFGVDTSDFKKGLKDGESAISDFKGAAGGILDEFASMFGVNMSGVTDAIGTANKSLNFLGEAFKGAAKGGDILAISSKVLKVALISTGIGAIVLGLGSLIAYFTKSGEGADKFAKILAQVKSVFNNVIDRIMKLGKGLFDIFSGRFKQGWEEMTSAFKGMGEEIKEDWKAAGALADAEDALEDREIALINSLEERRAKAAELRLQAKEMIGDEKTKLDLIKQAEALYKSVYSDQIGNEQERLRIMKEKLAIQSSDPTDEQRKAVAEQEAKINTLLREQAEQLKGLSREKGKVLAIVTEELALEKAKASLIIPVKADISNLKLPDFNQALSGVLAPLAKIQETVKGVSIDISTTLNEAFENIAAGMGEFIGSLMTGDAGMKDFAKLLLGTLADFAIQVGKIAIGAGIGLKAIKLAFESMNPAVAIAAGIALVALGTAIKGSLKSAASGGGGSAAASGLGSGGSGGSVSYGSLSKVSQSKLILDGTVVLKLTGPDLVALLNNENTRVNITT